MDKGTSSTGCSSQSQSDGLYPLSFPNLIRFSTLCILKGSLRNLVTLKTKAILLFHLEHVFSFLGKISSHRIGSTV